MKTLKILLIVFISFLLANDLSAQIYLNPNKKFKQSLEDSLHMVIDNDIYHTYYSPYISGYRSNHKEPVFTMLKIDIGWDGKVTGIQFSDSADSAFVKAYFNSPRANNRKDIFEKYAKVKSYSRVSLIIPVSYQPNSPNKEGVFSYDNVQSLTKFKGQSFIGPVVLLPTVIISVLSKNNM
jgi:hypothetical protein